MCDRSAPGLRASPSNASRVAPTPTLSSGQFTLNGFVFGLPCLLGYSFNIGAGNTYNLVQNGAQLPFINMTGSAMNYVNASFSTGTLNLGATTTISGRGTAISNVSLVGGNDVVLYNFTSPVPESTTILGLSSLALGAGAWLRRRNTKANAYV